MNLFNTLKFLGLETAENLHPLHKEVISISDLFSRSNQNVGTGIAGGFTVATNIGPVAEALFPYSAVIRAGGRVTTVSSDSRTPRITGSVSTEWVTESGSVTDSSITFGGISFSPRRISSTVTVSNQLLSQTGDLVEGIINSHVRAAIGYALDSGCLSGIGNPQPLGILNNDAITQTVTFSGAATLAKACSMERKVADAFAEQGPLSWIGSPATREKWRQLDKITGGGMPLWSDDNEVISHQAFATPAISNLDSRIVYGAFSLFQLVLFGAVEVLRDPYARKKTNETEFTFNLLADAGALHPEAFALSTDAANQ
jgi:HK97 family phage major capsid protein